MAPQGWIFVLSGLLASSFAMYPPRKSTRGVVYPVQAEDGRAGAGFALTKTSAQVEVDEASSSSSSVILLTSNLFWEVMSCCRALDAWYQSAILACKRRT